MAARSSTQASERKPAAKKAAKPAQKATRKPAKKAARSARKAPAGSPGRPSTFTAAIAREIADRIGAGEPLALICRDEHMPGLRTVYDWLEQDERFSASIARAREAGFDRIAAEALRIADTPMEGVVEKMGVDEDGNLFVVERRHEDMLGHRKLQIETRLKLLAKWDPKRYGDKLQVGGDAQNPTPLGVGVVVIPAKRDDDD